MCDANDDQQCRYIVCLIHELLRYFTVLRRRSVRDIPWDGKVIPAGSVVFLNFWACNNDPEIWSDPEVFWPERWLEQADAPMFTYGLGDRLCAGNMLADREMYLIWMRTLSSFKIEKAKGEAWDVDLNPLTGVSDPTQMVSMPKPDKVKFVPKDEAVLRAALEQSA